MSRRNDKQSGITLIELLVAMTIMTVVAGMIIFTLFSLQKSYSFTTTSDEQREFTRDAVSRITREIRDIQGPAGLEAVVAAEPYEFSFYTSFNLPNQLPSSQPKAARFTYDPATDTIYRQRDGTDEDSSADNEPRVAVIRNVMNGDVPAGSSTPVFRYVIYQDGHQVPLDRVTGPDMQSIVSVEMHVISDLNPDKAPYYFDLRTSAQLRNLRLH
jgi:prepilin-type N-terminal cleavage/methylation domain-containing protein